MKIISHRGYWKRLNEKNSLISFERSFSLGFGTETDLRDYKGEIVISHDIANSDSICLETFFKLYNEYTVKPLLALNIKADGLQVKLKKALEKYNVRNYFVFDMSIPDSIGYISNGFNFFSRQSEYEINPVFYEKSSGIWLDAFKEIWYDSELIKEHISNRKQVVIVSPDLHSRDVSDLWPMLKINGIHLLDGVILCTDTPEIAVNYFK